MKLFRLLKHIEVVYTLVKNPMMSGEAHFYVIEQTTSLKDIIKEHLNYKGDSLVKIGLRLNWRYRELPRPKR